MNNNYTCSVDILNLNLINTSANLNWDGVCLNMYFFEAVNYKFPKTNSLLMLMVVDGEMDGACIINDRKNDFKLVRDEILILSPNTYFEVKLQSNVKIAAFSISEKIVKNVSFDIFKKNNNFYNFNYKLSIKNNFLSNSIKSIIELAVVGECLSGIKVKYLASAIVAEIFEKYSALYVAEKKNNNELNQNSLQKTLNFIESNLHKNISADQLAAMSGVKYAQFSRLFKATMQVTLHQYIIQRRIEKARILLSETELKIVEIAQECGFSDQVHLTRLFNRSLGISPAAFRRKFRI